MANEVSELSDWERLLAAERHVQHLVPGAVLVGGTAVALHVRHRSTPRDRATVDLRTYRGLNAPWNDWDHLVKRARHFAGCIGARLLDSPLTPAFCKRRCEARP